jgi:hypothetical protein
MMQLQVFLKKFLESCIWPVERAAIRARRMIRIELVQTSRTYTVLREVANQSPCQLAIAALFGHKGRDLL